MISHFASKVRTRPAASQGKFRNDTEGKHLGARRLRKHRGFPRTSTGLKSSLPRPRCPRPSPPAALGLSVPASPRTRARNTETPRRRRFPPLSCCRQSLPLPPPPPLPRSPGAPLGPTAAARAAAIPPARSLQPRGGLWPGALIEPRPHGLTRTPPRCGRTLLTPAGRSPQALKRFPLPPAVRASARRPGTRAAGAFYSPVVPGRARHWF